MPYISVEGGGTMAKNKDKKPSKTNKSGNSKGDKKK
jgi:hypothetical protein